MAGREADAGPKAKASEVRGSGGGGGGAANNGKDAE